MSDKIEYSRLLIKRSTTPGETPTIPPITAVTLNQFTPTDIFEGEFFLNSFDDLLWVRTENGILPINTSGGTPTIPTLTQVLYEGNVTGGYDIVVSSGDTIQYQGLTTGSTITLIGTDASGYTRTSGVLTYEGDSNDLRITAAEDSYSMPRFSAVGSATPTLPEFGLQVGARGYSDTSSPGYGKTGDTYVYASRFANGLNIINGVGSGTTEDYIRFYAGTGATSVSNIHIQGSGTTRGYVGFNNENPTERIDVDGNIRVRSGSKIIFDGLSSGITTTLIGLDTTGGTITTTAITDVPTLEDVLVEGNSTGLNDIIVSSGASIVYEYLPTGATTQYLAIDADGRTILTSGGADGTSGTSGTSGVNGSSGTSGVDGSSGTSGIGTDGSSGTSGLSGVNGIDGTSGSSGVDGTSGVNGTSGTSGIDGTNGVDGTSGTSGSSGTSGTSGSSGVDGLSNSFFNYKAKTTSTTGDPGSGYLLWNNAIQSDTTAIHINETDGLGNNVDIFLAQLKSGTTITIQDQSSHLNYQTWEIGTPIDNSTYWEIPVTLVTSTYVFPNNHDVLFIVSSIPSGTSGTSGTSGSSGTSGVSGTDGSSGTSGINGVDGTSGTSGSSGTSPVGAVSSASITTIWSGSAADYAALGTYNNNTLYFIL